MEGEGNDSLPKDEEEMRQTTGDRIRQAREERGLKQSDIADAIGVKMQAVSNWERGKGISRENATRLADYLGVAVDWLLKGKSIQPSNVQAQATLEPAMRVSTYTGLTQRHPMSDARTPIMGSVRAGAWLEMDSLVTSEPAEFLPIPRDTAYPIGAYYALKVDGTSIDKVAANGDFLICLDLGKTGIGISERDLVIVQRTKPDGTREITAKRVHREAGTFILRPESHDPRWQEAIRFDPDNGDEVAVLARVEFVYRRP
jgi:transcriptional regulator with XRE-family HTH domain